MKSDLDFDVKYFPSQMGWIGKQSDTPTCFVYAKHIISTYDSIKQNRINKRFRTKTLGLKKIHINKIPLS